MVGPRGETGLGEIARENRRLIEEAELATPEACPFDGTRLDRRDDVLNCPLGDYRWEPGIGGRELSGPGIEAYTEAL